MTEKLKDFEMLTFKDFISELKKAKVKMSALEQKDLLELYEKTISEIADMDRRIGEVQAELDQLVFKIYEIPQETINRIMQ